MIADYEDDAHFCLKCELTILGLDNYVAHVKGGCSRRQNPPKSPLPSQLLAPEESFNLKADDFFSSLELQSSSKKIALKPQSGILTRSKITAIQASKDPEAPSKSGKNAWIGGHQLKELGSGDNQSRLIKAVDNLERNKNDLVEVYEDSEEESEDYEYDEDDLSDEDSREHPPRNHTGGKWKPVSPIPWSYPPPSFTGGKWKPGPKRSSPPPSHTRGKWKPSEEEVPSSHTGGKWVPKKQEYLAPPPNYTRGKWKPKDEELCKKKPKEEEKEKSSLYLSDNFNLVQEDKANSKKLKTKEKQQPIWCTPCNRKLASRIVYERHLKSDLHLKRALRDQELDDFSKPLDVKPESHKEIKKSRTKIYERCEVCNSRVNKSQIGKHLVSHYHCRKGDISSEKSKAMVLDNIHSIVLQSPFQCAVCTFYFNNHEDFLNHWLSEEHFNKQLKVKGYFSCSLCNYRTEDTHIMYQHLISAEHEEVISVINRSVPIVIRKYHPVSCLTCREEFLFNIQLLKHCQKFGHDSSNVKAGKIQYDCSLCHKQFFSNISLQRHKKFQHKEQYFICTPCNMSFDSKDKVREHRRTRQHRYNQLARTKTIGKKKCNICGSSFEDLQQYRLHLQKKHPDLQPRCPHCDKSFELAQDLGIHIRQKACQFDEKKLKVFSCDKCPYSSNSKADAIFHKVLHDDPFVLPGGKEDTGKDKVSYACPFCQRLFAKNSLLGHIRMHTDERPFVCAKCGASFVRKSNWLFHLKNHERKSEVRKAKVGEVNERPFLCSTCGANFAKKSILQQHMQIHNGKACKCPIAGCIFAARKMSELKVHFLTHSDAKNFSCYLCEYKGKSKQTLSRHMLIHTEEKKYQCSQCSFSTRIASHLKRHSRLHTGAKPFSCPHCSYRCYSLENLRKHVLSTNKHPGKCIYECKFCKDGDHFQSNFAKEFKAHLVTQHSQMFGNGSEAASYVSGIYKVDNDPDIDFRQRTDTSQLSDGMLKMNSLVSSNMEETLTVIDKAEVIATEVKNDSWGLEGKFDIEGTLVAFVPEEGLFEDQY